MTKIEIRRSAATRGTKLCIMGANGSTDCNSPNLPIYRLSDWTTANDRISTGS